MDEVIRVTLVLPRKLWDEVKQIVPSGQRSRLVAQALETEIRRQRQELQLDRLQQFQDYLSAKYGTMPDSVDDLGQMREERDAEISGLR
jgi:metal-responsive CopG/Arc/MetJ family transcriptional regulator